MFVLLLLDTRRVLRVASRAIEAQCVGCIAIVGTVKCSEGEFSAVSNALRRRLVLAMGVQGCVTVSLVLCYCQCQGPVPRAPFTCARRVCRVPRRAAFYGILSRGFHRGRHPLSLPPGLLTLPICLD